jgi:hypothetical protein
MNKLEIVKDGDIARLKVTKQVNGSPFTYTAPKTCALEGSEDGAISAIVENLNETTAVIPEGTSEENPLVNETGLGEVVERVTTTEHDIDAIEEKIPSGASSSNKLVTESGMEDALSAIGTGYTPKGNATVATLESLTGQSNGDMYIVTDSGTLNNGALVVSAGNSVAWDSTNEVWYKTNQYATQQEHDALKTYAQNVAHSIAPEFDPTRD